MHNLDWSLKVMNKIPVSFRNLCFSHWAVFLQAITLKISIYLTSFWKRISLHYPIISHPASQCSKILELYLPFRYVLGMREGGKVNHLSRIIIILLKSSNFVEECMSWKGIPEYSSPTHPMLTCLVITIQLIYSWISSSEVDDICVTWV
jgi:hypothetical protein